MPMLADLEKDFANQQRTLVTLLTQRKRMNEGSQVADEFDRKIMAAENLILSYEALKWYERYGSPIQPVRINQQRIEEEKPDA
jgi:hypothetical protein